MAYIQEPLMKATAKQFETIIAARNTPGAHIFYTGGYHTDKKQLKLELPSPLGYRFVFTSLFEYKGSAEGSGTRSHIFLANKTKSNQHYLRFDFSSGYGLLYVLEGSLQNARVNAITSPIKGLHVLEITVEVVHLDNQVFFPPEDVHADLDELLLFYSALPDANAKADFVFWESHCTKEHTFVQFQDKFTFKHENLSIRNGGYALFHGVWDKGIELELTTGTRAKPIKRKLKSTGDTACLLKVYSESLSFSHAGERSGVVLADARGGAPLDVLFLHPMPSRIIELTIVTGEPL